MRLSRAQSQNARKSERKLIFQLAVHNYVKIHVTDTGALYAPGLKVLVFLIELLMRSSGTKVNI